MRCTYCGTSLKGWRAVLRAILSRGYVVCPDEDFSACVATRKALIERPPDYEAMDWANPPPEDIEVCPTCKGAGEVFSRRDWATGAYETELCGRCDSTGLVGPWSYI